MALSGFFTSCATPAERRPSAASLREYRIVDCTWPRYSRLRAISMMPTRSPFGSLIACVMTRCSIGSPSWAWAQRSETGPRDCRLTSVCSISFCAGWSAETTALNDVPTAASGSRSRIAGFMNSSSSRALTIATASSRCSTADSRFATCPAMCDRSADNWALTALKKVPSSPNSSC